MLHHKRRRQVTCLVWPARIAAVFGALLICAAAHSQTGRDQITVFVPAFHGPDALGQNVATVLNLQLWHTFRRYPWPDNPENLDFGPAAIVWSPNPLEQPTHEAAFREARDLDVLAQVVVWGKAYHYGEGIVVQTNITLPKFNDFRNRHLEIWRIEVNGRGLQVDVPRRRFEMSSMVLATDFIARYSAPASLKIYSERVGGEPVGTVGEQFRGIQFEPDLALVQNRDVTGWVRLPQLSRQRNEVVDMVAGIVRVFRGDWHGAISMFNRVIASPSAREPLNIDALLLRGMAKERLGRPGGEDFDLAYASSPYSRTTVQYVLMSKVAQLSRARGRPGKVTQLRSTVQEIVERHRHLFAEDDDWLADLSRILDAVAE